jgi:RimJ/RimL family protein N-acetyltransferase
MLETERLLLRMPRLDDADAAFEYLGDPEVMRFIGGETVPRKDVPSVIQRWLDRWEANGFGHFALVRRDDGRFLGRIGMIVWDTRTWRNTTLAEAGDSAQPELGWALAREHWGRGYATEGAAAVREWARGELGVRRLISLIAPENVASARVAQRLGAAPQDTIVTEGGVECVVWLHPQAGQEPAR